VSIESSLLKKQVSISTVPILIEFLHAPGHMLRSLFGIFKNRKAALTPQETVLLQIIKDPRNHPDLSETERFEFVKTEFLKPENTGLIDATGDILVTFADKGYIAKIDEPDADITDMETQQFWRTLTLLRQSGEFD